MCHDGSASINLINDLLGWLKSTEQHPLICSSVFHYEFEFIHPFEDGYGRMGRLWQSLILNKWNPLFSNIPIESFINEHQRDYYSSISRSTSHAESTVFIEFMLKMIRTAISSSNTPEVENILTILSSELKRKGDAAETRVEG